MRKNKIELHKFVERKELLTILNDLLWLQHVNKFSLYSLYIGLYIRKCRVVLERCHSFSYEPKKLIDKLEWVASQSKFIV